MPPGPMPPGPMPPGPMPPGPGMPERCAIIPLAPCCIAFLINIALCDMANSCFACMLAPMPLRVPMPIGCFIPMPNALAIAILPGPIPMPGSPGIIEPRVPGGIPIIPIYSTSYTP
eukprot:518302-Hanusia_phi.AAC.1